MKEKKMTKKDYFNALIDVVEGYDVDNKDMYIEFLNHEIELLSKKSTAKTKTQKENEVLIEDVYKVLAEIGRPVTITEVIQNAGDSVVATMTNQKVSALMKILKNAGRVVRVDDKKKAYFSINED